MTEKIKARKAEHIRLASEEAVEAPGSLEGAIDSVELVYQALPEINRDDVDTRTRFLGKTLKLPFLIGSMTGGTEEAHRINLRLAEAAAHCGVGMCLGSQRIMLENPASTYSFDIRKVAPEILLISNLGAVQLNLGVGVDQIRRLVQEVGADALVLHLNAAQEAIQEGGDTQFAGLMEVIEKVVPEIGVPCGVKEVGGGFSTLAARNLAKLPLAFVESAGRGGTSWTLLEGLRAQDQRRERMGRLFASWGVPSVTSLLNCVQSCSETPIIASGGIRSGLDIARSIALGASVAASARPLLQAATESTEAVIQEIEFFGESLRTAMFLTGASDVEALSRVPYNLPRSIRPEHYEGGGLPRPL